MGADVTQLVNCLLHNKNLSSDARVHIKQWAQWCMSAIQALGRQNGL